jgi:ComF family protein
MSLLDVLFPAKCFGCGYLGVYVCPSCEGNLRQTQEQTCLYCDRPSLHGLTHPGCRRRGGVDGHVSLFYYDNLLKKIIKEIKYSFVRAAQNDLFYLVAKYGEALLIYYGKIPDISIQPIPLSREKQLSRGFNQAKTIARAAALLSRTRQTELIARHKNTKTQAKIKSQQERRENMRGAFSFIGAKVDGGEVLLVDDVVTTGSTVKEAAKTLKGGGVERVYVFSVAKG